MSTRIDVDPAEPREALVELVASAIIYGMGAWGQAMAGEDHAEHQDADGDLEEYAVARAFLAAYRTPVEVDTALADIDDSVTAAKHDAMVYGTGWLRVDLRFGAVRLARVDPEAITIKGLRPVTQEETP